ncbi:MAG: hypothetical protein IKT62_03780 [Firmicutes bacterium]|nr:hypothetical protein [Bacillota bacterium]
MNRTAKTAQKFEAQRREERKLALKFSGYLHPTDEDTKVLGKFQSYPLNKRVQKKGDKR